MPIYEYACGACGHRMEALQRMSDDPLTDCPECHKKELKKLISAAAFRLKGAGWYETDFKSGDKKKNLANSDSSTSDSKPTKSADSGSDSKKKKSETKGSESKTKKTDTKSSSNSGSKKKSSSKE